MKRRVAIVVGVLAAAFVGAGILYQYGRVCCSPPRVPLDQYWFKRINTVHQNAATEPTQPNAE